MSKEELKRLNRNIKVKDVIAGTTPTLQVARTWVMLLPLLYFANGGRLQASADAPSDAGPAHKIALLAACMICSYFVARRFRTLVGAFFRTKIIFSLPLIALLSCTWSVEPRQSVISAITLMSFTLFAVYLSETLSSRSQMEVLMCTGSVAIVASFALAILAPKVGRMTSGWNGIFGHKQQCAAAVTVFIVTALHWTPRTDVQRLFRVLYVLSGLVLIILSQSRTGWLLLLIAVSLSCCLWFLQRFAAKDALFLLLTAIPTLGGLAYLISLFATLILTGVGKDPTLSQRTIIWSAAWNAIQKHLLLGYGYEAFWQGLTGASHDIILIAGWNLAQAQSGYLDLWIQLGIGGVACLLLMLGQAGFNAVHIFRRAGQPSFVRWCIVVIICNLIYNIGESDYGYLRIVWFLFVMACLGLQKERLALMPRTEAALVRAAGTGMVPLTPSYNRQPG